MKKFYKLFVAKFGRVIPSLPPREYGRATKVNINKIGMPLFIFIDLNLAKYQKRNKKLTKGIMQCLCVKDT